MQRVFIIFLAFLFFSSPAKSFAQELIIEKPSEIDREINENSIYLHQDKHLYVINTIERFMGFISVISPAPVINYKSERNTQYAKILKCNKKKEIATFYVWCDFEFTGKGYFVSIFDKEKVIKNTLERLGKKSGTKKLIKEMSVENGGLGYIEIEGNIDKDIETVNKVKVNFSGRGVDSPVKIILFEGHFVEGVYINNINETLTTATVKSLSFRRKKDADKPKMEIKLESIGESNTLLGKTSAFIANNFILEPITITERGNLLMLDFGDALLKNRRYFSFAHN